MNNKGIYFTELILQNVRCLGERAVLKLSNDAGEWSKWNVILGDNGTGKTTLLQCLAGMEQVKASYLLENERPEWDCIAYLNKNYSLRQSSHENSSEKFTLITSTIVDVGNFRKTNLEYSQHSDIVDGTSILTNKQFASFFIIGYGANRRISFQILSEKETKLGNSITLFDDDAKLINAEEWLFQMEFAASRDSEIKELAIKRRDLIIDTLKNILPDVDNIRFKEPTSLDKPVPKLEFKTPYGWVSLQELSYGYKTMVAWIVDVAAQMFRRYPDSDNPLEEPVVILVDEIDLHLHPKWQREIFNFLGNRFPRAQFIVTAHSPLIVQSAPKDANIIVLRKEKEGDEYVVKIDNDVESVRTWRLDQIMNSDLFDAGTRNPEIDEQMKERSELLQKETAELTAEQQQRLSFLNQVSDSLPTATNPADIDAMEIIRKAAQHLKKQ